VINRLLTPRSPYQISCSFQTLKIRTLARRQYLQKTRTTCVKDWSVCTPLCTPLCTPFCHTRHATEEQRRAVVTTLSIQHRILKKHCWDLSLNVKVWMFYQHWILIFLYWSLMLLQQYWTNYNIKVVHPEIERGTASRWMRRSNISCK